MWAVNAAMFIDSPGECNLNKNEGRSASGGYSVNFDPVKTKSMLNSGPR